MANATLTVNGITFTFDEGDIDTIESSIVTGVDALDMALSGPGGTYLYDFAGVTKTITIKGKISDAATTRTSSGTISTMEQQKQWLESIANGNQAIILFTSTYDSQSILQSSGATSPFQGAFTLTRCMLKSLTITEVAGEMNTMPYTLVLVVGRAT